MTTLYRIRNWDANFENNKSRERAQCSFVCMPNKQDGHGLTYILTEPDGAAIFGVWCLILQACSRQKKREGWLTVDGHQTGTPWALDDLALRWRRKPEEIKRALDFVCSPKINWVECLSDIINVSPVTECPPSARVVPAECPRGALKEGRKEEKERREVEEQNSPPPIPIHSGGIEKLRTALRKRLLPTSADALEEWQDLFKEMGCKGWVESEACLHFCVDAARDAGKPIKYAREAVEYAMAWRNGNSQPRSDYDQIGDRPRKTYDLPPLPTRKIKPAEDQEDLA